MKKSVIFVGDYTDFLNLCPRMLSFQHPAGKYRRGVGAELHNRAWFSDRLLDHNSSPDARLVPDRKG